VVCGPGTISPRRHSPHPPVCVDEFDHQRRLVAIMFTDIVGFSRLMAEGEARALRILDRHDAILAEQIAAQGGKVLKRMGDSIFASFDSATNAVRCAIAIQQALAAYNNACVGDERLAVRIGVHLGDVIERHGDLFGDGINVAARLQPLAKPGGVCISSGMSFMSSRRFTTWPLPNPSRASFPENSRMFLR